MELIEQLTQKFVPLPVKAQEDLLSKLEEWEYPANYDLVKPGKVCNYIYWVAQGAIRSFYLKDGKEVNSWFAFEGDLVTSYYSFISRKPGYETIQLLENCRLYSIRFEELQLLADQHAPIEKLQRLILQYYYLELEERLISLQFQTARERYEHLLEHYPQVLQRISLGHIASYLGITQETLSRIRAPRDPTG